MLEGFVLVCCDFSDQTSSGLSLGRMPLKLLIRALILSAACVYFSLFYRTCFLLGCTVLMFCQFFLHVIEVSPPLQLRSLLPVGQTADTSCFFHSCLC